MAHDPLVSVVIPCHNRARYLAETIATVLGQAYPAIECLVVDDGSTDETEAVVSEFAERDGRVRYAKQEHGGPASARNRGARMARGDLIQFFDSDDWMCREKLSRQVRLVREKPISDDRYVLYSDYAIVPWREGAAAGPERTYTWEGLDRDALKTELIGRRFGLGTPTPLSVCSTLMSRSVIEEFSFREDMETYEDLEFFLRLLASDTGFYHTPVKGFVYRSHGESLSNDPGARARGYLGFLESVETHCPEHLDRCPNLGFLLRHFARRGEYARFRKAMDLARKSNAPIYRDVGKDERRRALLLDGIGGYYLWLRGGVQTRRLRRGVRHALGRRPGEEEPRAGAADDPTGEDPGAVRQTSGDADRPA